MKYKIILSIILFSLSPFVFSSNEDPKEIYRIAKYELIANSNYKKAIDGFERYIKIKGKNNIKNSYVYEKIAFAKNEIGDLLGAINSYNEAINIFPNSALLYRKRSELKMSNGDEIGANRDYNLYKYFKNNEKLKNYPGYLSSKIQTKLDIDNNIEQLIDNQMTFIYELKNSGQISIKDYFDILATSGKFDRALYEIEELLKADLDNNKLIDIKSQIEFTKSLHKTPLLKTRQDEIKSTEIVKKSVKEYFNDCKNNIDNSLNKQNGQWYKDNKPLGAQYDSWSTEELVNYFCD